MIRVDFGATTTRTRCALALGVALIAAGLSWAFWSSPQGLPSDLAQVWAATHSLLQGQNPYDAIGPGRTFDWPYPLLYPLTAVVALIPLAPLPLRLVDPVFTGLGFGLFAWAVTRQGLLTPALVSLVSVAAILTLKTSQWSLLLTGAALVPTCGFLLIAKPTIGLALFAAYPHWKTALGCGVLLLASLFIRPSWLIDWRSTFASAPHVVAPVMQWGGPLLLLSAFKWRRPEARLLLGLACVPHTPSPMDTIPLYLIPQTWFQAWVLWGLGFLAFIGHHESGPYLTRTESYAGAAQWDVALVYLPCLVAVLARPNVMPVTTQHGSEA